VRASHHSWILLAFAGLACANTAPGGIQYASGRGSVTPDGLHLVQWEPFRETFVKPGADLQRYDKVLVQEVTVSYKTPPGPDRLAQGGMEPNYALPESAMRSLKQYFHQAFVKALGDSQNFTISEAPGPDVLLISGHIVNLEVAVPPAMDQDPDDTDYTNSSGQMTLILDARDSQSGEPLVRVGQVQAIGMVDGGFYQSDPVTNSAAVQEMFQGWASDLRRELDQFHALPALPPLDGPASYEAAKP